MKGSIFTIVLMSILLLVSNISYAQREEIGEAVKFYDTTWYDRGFDFYIGGGMFMGNKKNALYYNGSKRNECNINYLLDNEYRKKEIKEAVIQLHPNISASDELNYNESDLNWNPNYNISVLVSLGIRFKLRKNWAIALSYSFSRMTINNNFLLTYTSVAGNNVPAPELTLFGKEDRSMIDLSLSYLFSQTHRIVKPFIEVGAQFNYQKLKDFDMILLDNKKNEVLKLSLIDRYGASYIPGVQQYDNGYIFGGPGFGISFSAGIKFVVNKFVSIDPTFYGSYCNLNLKPLGERVFSFNYGAMVRIVMNDFFFQNR